MTAVLKAPFPYFGGKSGVAAVVWERFGDVPNYVEPFAGSLAVLLARPHDPKVETINDLDGLLSNAWRAIRCDPDAVAHYADQPVVEIDLHARHIALVNVRQDLTARLMADPDYYDARLAGWWIWGACNWIGSGWCNGSGPWVASNGRLVKRERAELAGVSRKLPHLGDGGKGVNRKLPHVALPARSDLSPLQAGHPIVDWMHSLSARLRRVRMCCGDWTRVLGSSVTTKHGYTAIFLDPPYNAEDADNDVYGVDYDGNVSAAVRAWAIAEGDNPLLRIAICGYDGEHHLPQNWEKVPWKANKGYKKTKSDGTHNGEREVIWFSPHCIRPQKAQVSLWE